MTEPTDAYAAAFVSRNGTGLLTTLDQLEQTKQFKNAFEALNRRKHMSLQDKRKLLLPVVEN